MAYRLEDGLYGGSVGDVVEHTRLPGYDIKRYVTSFEAAATFTLTHLSYPIRFQNGSKSTITSIWAEVWTVDGNDHPVSKLGQSTNAVNGNDIGNEGSNYTGFVFTGVSIVSGTRYGLILDMDCATYDQFAWEGKMSNEPGHSLNAWIDEYDPPGYVGWSDTPSVTTRAQHFKMYSGDFSATSYYVSHRGDAVRIIDDSGIALVDRGITSDTMTYPGGMCYDPDGHIWVAWYSSGIYLTKIRKDSLTTEIQSSRGIVGANSCQGNPVMVNGNIYCPHQNNSHTQNFAKYNVASDTWSFYICYDNWTGCYGSALSSDGKYIYVGFYTSAGQTTPRFGRFNIELDAFDAYYGEMAGNGYIPGAFATILAPDGTIVFGCGTQFGSQQCGWDVDTDTAVYAATSLGIKQVYLMEYASGTTMIAGGSSPGQNIVAFDYQTGVLTGDNFSTPSVTGIGRNLQNGLDVGIGGTAGADQDADGSYNFRVFNKDLDSPRKLLVDSGSQITGVLAEQNFENNISEYFYIGYKGAPNYQELYLFTDDGTTIELQGTLDLTKEPSDVGDVTLTDSDTHIYWGFWSGSDGYLCGCRKSDMTYLDIGGQDYRQFDGSTEYRFFPDLYHYGGYLFTRAGYHGTTQTAFLKHDPTDLSVITETLPSTQSVYSSYQMYGDFVDGKMYVMAKTAAAIDSWVLYIYDCVTGVLTERPSDITSAWAGGPAYNAKCIVNSTGTKLIMMTNTNSSFTYLHLVDIATGLRDVSYVIVNMLAYSATNIDDYRFHISGGTGPMSDWVGKWSDLSQINTYDLDYATQTQQSGLYAPSNEICRLSVSNEADAEGVTANIRMFNINIDGYTRYYDNGDATQTSQIGVRKQFLGDWISRISAMSIATTPDYGSKVMNIPTLSGDWDGDHAIALTLTDNSIAGDIQLDWVDVDPYENLTVYEIYRSLNGGAFSLVKTTAAGVITWTDTNLTPGTYQYYGVPTRPDIPDTAPASNTTYDFMASPIGHYDVIRTQVTGETPPESYTYTTVTDALTWTSASQLYEDLSAGIVASELTNEPWRYYQVRGDDGSTQSAWSNAQTTQITMGPFDASMHLGHTDITQL